MGTIALKLLLVALYAWLYQAGGRAKTPGGKAIRRWVGSSVMVIGLIWFSIFGGTMTWYRALVFPLFFGTAILGYGGDDVVDKAVRRLIYGVAFGTFGLLLGAFYGEFMLGAAQCFLAVSVSLYLGIFNPDKAAEEEAMIGLLSTVFLPFMVS